MALSHSQAMGNSAPGHTAVAQARTHLREALESLIQWAEDLQECGVGHVECDPAALSQLVVPPTAQKRPEERLAEIARRIAQCRRCPLHRTRTRTVPGQGNPSPELVFVGEGPGTEEDRQGLAFVGPAGQLLTRLIRALGMTREEVFIANIVKCRPTERNEGVRDRPPTDEEMSACLPYLHEQLDVLRPKVIVCLGATALRGLLGLQGISRLRGKWQNYRGIPVMPTYHPSYLLRAGGEGKELYWQVWEDMCEVLRQLGRPVPERRRRS